MTDASADDRRHSEEQYDPELAFRRHHPYFALFVTGLLLAMTLFHLYVAGFGPISEQMLRGIHLAFVLALVFLMFAPTRRATRQPPRRSGLLHPGGVGLWDWALCAAGVAGALYVPLLPNAALAVRAGNLNQTDMVFGTMLIVVVLEATRRSVGPVLTVIAALFIAYAVFGQDAPGVLRHPGMTWAVMIDHLYMTLNGIYGVAIGAVAQYVFLFVVFGVLATRIGLGQLFIDVASCVAGRYAGGPAKVAIFSSAMLGTISGSSIANTVTTGSLTIPAMKKVGYPPHFAGAVEATASTGGQITPPIMGAAAFIMVDFLEVPYREILLAALVPAALHYFGIFVMVHLEAKRLGLRGLRPDELPRFVKVIRDHWPTLIPLATLVYMIVAGRSPDNAAFWGVVGCIVVGFLNPRDRLTLPALMTALSTGAKYALAVGAAAAAVGIIVGVVTSSGVGFNLGAMVTQVAANVADSITLVLPEDWLGRGALTLFFTLLFTAIACVVMGAGIPTTATYVILVSIAAPTLGLLSVPPLVAHFFVFYYGVLADITPPVALAAYAGAGIAGANPFRTGNTAFRLGIAKALVPFVFVYSPSLLLVVDGFTWDSFAITLAGAMIGIAMLGTAFSGYMLAPVPAWGRWMLGFASLLFVSPGLETMAAGAVLAAPVVAQQAIARRNSRQEAAPT
ncbi:MAG: TRAP transporter permease [Alphaproteobacteria bacterium]